MSTLAQVLEAALKLPLEEQETLMQAMQKKHAEIRRKELVEYAQQMKQDVRSGKLQPKSVTEIMGQLDDTGRYWYRCGLLLVSGGLVLWLNRLV